MSTVMNSSNSFDSPMRSQGSYGDFARPNFSPVFTSSPRGCRNDSSDFIPFGPSSPGASNRGRGRWRGRNRSLLSNTSTSSGQNSSFSPGMGQRSSPYKQNSPRGHWRGRGNQGYSRNHSQMHNISDYYHPSMLADPWAKLEEMLEVSESHYSSLNKPEGINFVQGSDTDSSVENEQSIEISSQQSVS